MICAATLVPPAFLQPAFFWLLAFLVGAPYPLLLLSYRRTLNYKLQTLRSFMANNSIFAAYLRRFGKRNADPNAAVDELFGLTYHWSTYALAVVLNMVVIAAAVCICAVRGGIPMGVPSALNTLIASVPPTLLLGLSGAYVLGLYDTLGRYRVGDLYPSYLHFNWLHMVVAGFLAPLLSQAFAPAIAYPVAFGIGIFPLKDSLDAARKYAAKRLELTPSTPATEGAALNKIQGMTQQTIDRLEEEDITSTVHLAYSDPIKLLLRTNISWVILLDLMDQAVLFNYLGEQMAQLRSMGVRGAIEVAAIGQRLYEGDAEDQRCAHLAINLLASRLSSTDEAALILVRTLYEDGQVDLLWELYTDETPTGVLRDERAAAAQKPASPPVLHKIQVEFLKNQPSAEARPPKVTEPIPAPPITNTGEIPHAQESSATPKTQENLTAKSGEFDESHSAEEPITQTEPAPSI